MDSFTVYAIIHAIDGDITVLVGSYEFIVQATLAADQHHEEHPARSVWITNNTTGKRHCQWVGTEAVGGFELGEEVYIHNPGGIDDGEIGTIEEINGSRYRVQCDFRDSGSWWEAHELSSAAAKSYFYGEIRRD
jgi:hypothetical protein